MTKAESRLIESLPPEAAELGPIERVHPALTSIASPQGACCLLSGLIILAFGTLFVYSGLSAPMRNATPEGLIGGGAFLLVLGVALVGRALRYYPPSMTPGKDGAGYIVFEDALAFHNGKQWHIVRWQDVEELTNARGAGDYHLISRQAYTMPIEHSVKRYHALIARVFEEVTGHLVPRVLKAVASGETAIFGPFAVSREALGYQDKSLAWSQLGSITLIVGPRRPRQLRLRTKGRLTEWCLAPIDTVPSTDVFLQVIQMIHEAWILEPAGPSLSR